MRIKLWLSTWSSFTFLTVLTFSLTLTDFHLIKWLLFLFLCRFLHRYAQDSFNSRRKDWCRFIWHVVFFCFWVFIQSFSFSFLEFYISAVKKNDLSFCFPDVDGGITWFSGFWVTPQVIFNTFFMILHQNYKKHGWKTSYNFITEKVKHVFFNSFGNSRDSDLLQVIKLTTRYIEIWIWVIRICSTVMAM